MFFKEADTLPIHDNILPLADASARKSYRIECEIEVNVRVKAWDEIYKNLIRTGLLRLKLCIQLDYSFVVDEGKVLNYTSSGNSLTKPFLGLGIFFWGFWLSGTSQWSLRIRRWDNICSWTCLCVPELTRGQLNCFYFSARTVLW